MTPQFTTYQHALILRELGFNEECFKLYTTGANAGDTMIALWLSRTVFGQEECTNSMLSHKDSCTAPLWQQTKEYLWEWYRIRFEVSLRAGIYQTKAYGMYRTKSPKKLIMKATDKSPIISEINCMRLVIEDLKNKKQ